MKRVFVLCGVVGLLVAACGGETPQDFLSNPLLQSAIAGSGFTYTLGSTPPNIMGQYLTSGTFTKANPSSIAGDTMSTTYCYYNQQTTSVDSLETAPTTDPSYRSVGPGLLVSGTGQDFTIWKDAHSTSSSCTQHTYVLFSGTVGSDQHLRGQWLTVVIDVTSGCGDVQPGWWRWAGDVDFAPNGTCNGS